MSGKGHENSPGKLVCSRWRRPADRYPQQSFTQRLQPAC